MGVVVVVEMVVVEVVVGVEVAMAQDANEEFGICNLNIIGAEYLPIAIIQVAISVMGI